MTPPAPRSPSSQSELAKKHLQGEARLDGAALNSSSGARGSHISQSTTVGSSVWRLRPRGSCRRSRLIDPRGSCTGRAAGKVTHVDPNTALQRHRQWFARQKFGKAQAFQLGSVGASPFSHCSTHIWEGSKMWCLKHSFDSEVAHKRHYSPCRLRFYPAQQHFSLSLGTARSWTLPPFVIVCNTMPTRKTHPSSTPALERKMLLPGIVPFSFLQLKNSDRIKT